MIDFWTTADEIPALPGVYVLAISLSVGEFVRGHEQDQALVECFRPDGGACTLLPRCRLRGMLAAAKDAFYQHLDRYTLADCLAGPGSSAHERPNRKRPRRSGSRGTAEMIDSLEALRTTRIKR